MSITSSNLAPALSTERADLRRWPILLLMAGATALLFTASSLRHHMFRSGAMDLGFFDQAIFLISRGERPFSSILGFHILADHAAYTLYLLAPLYRIAADVHVLLAVQAIALSFGAYPLWKLALGAGASRGQAIAIALAYLLYPIVLAANVFDFHPETLSVPALLFAVLAARERKPVLFAAALIIALGGKEILSVTVAALGFWMFFFDNRRAYGVAAMLVGIGWFFFSTGWLIPHFGAGRASSGMQYFNYLGKSIPDILVNAFTHPGRWMSVMFSVRAAKYIVIMLLPVCWGLSPRYLMPLIVVAGPTMLLNILADSTYIDMTKPFGHYSLMVVPFLFVSIIGAVAAGQSWLQRPRWIATWAVGLVVLGAGARVAMVRGERATDFDDHAASREAIASIDDNGGVLTTHEIVPHLSQRPMVQYISEVRDLAPVESFDYVLLNFSHSSAKSSEDLTETIQTQVERDPNFKLAYQKGDVYLYRKQAISSAQLDVLNLLLP